PTADGLVVTGAGGALLRGGSARSHGDHRIAMALAVAGLVARRTTRIDGWDAVPVSYPDFARDLQQLRR
ncbi:MAG: 3-phosphoshikimate 1-carboxyvinyltransferase, partial [Acidimicrobiales bacterium]